MTAKRLKSNIVRATTKAYVPFPFDPNDEWGWRVRRYVKGSVGGCYIRGVLRSEGGGYALPLGAAWLRDNVIPTSPTVDVVLEPDGPQSEALAEDIAQALQCVAGSRNVLSIRRPFYRKNFLRWRPGRFR